MKNWVITKNGSFTIRVVLWVMMFEIIYVQANLKEVVQENQCFCWNPSISGTKSEDAIIAMKDGFKFITKPILFPKMEVKVNGITFQRPAILEKVDA